MSPRLRRIVTSSCVAAASLLLSGPAPAAGLHEVPAEVTVQLWVRAADGTMTVLVRVPLEAMRDVDFPLEAPGYLVLDELEPFLREAAELWVADELAFFEDGSPLPTPTVRRARVSVPSDRSFGEWASALGHVRGPALNPAIRIPVGQALLDLELEVPVGDAESRFALEPGLAHLGIRTLSVIHVVRPDGGERVFQYRGDPGRIRLDPTWMQAAAGFVWSGVRHILGGLDHLLFLLCLIIPFRRVRPLIPVVTAFTVAHSITLLAAALGLTPRGLWFPPLVETLIALSIVYMALENLLGVGLQRRWGLAFAFGLIHGFGFSFVLGDSLQFAGGHLATALLAFNLGVELGQLAVLVVVVPALGWLLSRVPERAGVVVLSAVVAHQAWHWMTARGGELLQFRPALPPLDAALLATALRWGALALLAAGAAWGLAELYRRLGWTAGPTAGGGTLEAEVDAEGVGGLSGAVRG